MKTQLDSVDVESILDSLILWVDPKKQQATNESMAKNPKLIDLSGNGYDATCYNFAWSGMSGIGGYAVDFTEGYSIYVTVIESTYKIVHCTTTGIECWPWHFEANKLAVKPFSVKISGLNGQLLRYYYYDGTVRKQINITSDGVYDLPESIFSDSDIIYCGFYIPANEQSLDVTIEQLPLYPNALVSDGVDDYAQVTGLPLLTKERGYTVIAKRKNLYQLNEKGIVASKHSGSNYGAFQIEYNFDRIKFNATNFGAINIIQISSSEIIYQTSKSYNGETSLNIGTYNDTSILDLFKYIKQYFGKVALYSLLLFDRDLTTAEIEWVKENMVEADGVMMYDWMYGFRLHNTDSSKRCEGTLTSYKITVTDVYSKARFFESFLNKYEYYNPYKIKVTGLPAGVKLKYTADDTVISEISSDGEYMLPAIDGTYEYVGFQFDNTFGSENITIQQLLTHFNMANIKFYRGPKNSYVQQTHQDGIYFSTDSHEIIVNNIIYGVGKAIGDITYNASNRKFTLTIVGNNSTTSTITLDLATSSTAGLMSAEDKQKLDLLTGGDSGSIQQQIEEAINTLKATINAYTINGKKISTNPVLSGQDITLTGYVSEVEAPIVTSTDSVNEGIQKLEENLSTLQGIVNKNYLTVGISSSQTVFEQGVQITPTLNISVKFDGSVVEPDTLELKKGSNQLTTDSSTTSYKDSDGITTTTTYSVTISYQGVIKSASVVVRSYYAMYFGFNSKSSGITQEDILALTKQPIKANANGTYTISGAEQGEYGWFCVPTEFTINKMTSSGFDVPLESPSTVSVNAHNYKCYRTSNALAAGNMNVVIS